MKWLVVYFVLGTNILAVARPVDAYRGTRSCIVRYMARTYLCPCDGAPNQAAEKQHVLLRDGHREARGETHPSAQAYSVHRQGTAAVQSINRISTSVPNALSVFEAENAGDWLFSRVFDWFASIQDFNICHALLSLPWSKVCTLRVQFTVSTTAFLWSAVKTLSIPSKGVKQTSGLGVKMRQSP